MRTRATSKIPMIVSYTKSDAIDYTIAFGTLMLLVIQSLWQIWVVIYQMHSYSTFRYSVTVTRSQTWTVLNRNLATTPDNLPFSHNIVNGVVFPPFINQKHVDEFSFSYSLITKSKYGSLKGVLVLVIVN